ncbi:putative S-adenosyl-L-methionine-dependent methyltransferase protein [Corchorus olitorius]|uniref:Methyltransferase n=1 Tax=Corchorus olitorius TaxID=93759 RepID=A0A1R3I046_9ROSI|nr:putative S-adenosyl-L-methionine-dependent methyltransferase protein [Corchorus olitorius]
MAISVPSLFKERKYPFLFALSILLISFAILLLSNSFSPFPSLPISSDLHVSTSHDQSPSPLRSQSQTDTARSPPELQSGNDDAVPDVVDLNVSLDVQWRNCKLGAASVDYIPCLDNWKAIKELKSRTHMEHRERHCPSPSPRCLVPLPSGYKVPVQWPKSRDMVWYDNVPHPKLVEYKKEQNWVRKSGDYFVFPGGGTQFKNGVNSYIDYIQKTLPAIKWGKNIRVILDVGCGVASFGGYLLDQNVITMSFAPKDEHEAQIQFALERGIPATLSVIGTQKLTFPDNAYDLIHCARCRVHWDGDGGKPLLELNRILRPGGYFIWWPTPWPQRLTSKPPSLPSEPDAEDIFNEDTKHWAALVSDVYLDGLGISWASIRNVMDMNAGYGGFAAALIELPLWVMNVVPINAQDTLPIIFDRGLIGVYHDWCESVNTYPRTYDLLHSSFLFKNHQERCDIIDVVVEMDRILRPGGYLLLQDTMETIKKLNPVLRSLHWSTSLYQGQFLVAKKGFWRPGDDLDDKKHE